MEDQIRLLAFKWLEEQTKIYDDILPRTILEKGFVYNGRQITLIGPQGIWKPKEFEKIPISITTTPNSPYNDSLSSDGLIKYKYMGTDPYNHVNAGLRLAITNQTPLIYFFGLMPSKYIAVWPVFIVADDLNDLCFTVAVDEIDTIIKESNAADYIVDGETGFRRKYITSKVKRRLHQQAFREIVLNAYMQQCSLCKLRHRQLLDAAHIISDTDELGDPIINNGISLCKIHHAVFDSNIIGITPDYIINVRQDILYESDGPMLKHGIQELHNKRILLPKKQAHWPDRERLDIRFNEFMKAI